MYEWLAVTFRVMVASQNPSIFAENYPDFPPPQD